jgi:hypothetical protein
MTANQTPILLLVALKNELEAISIPKSIPIAYTGVGKINAATVTQTAIAHHQPQLIINFGTVGKINPDLSDLITIKRVVQRDMNAEPLAPVVLRHFAQSQRSIRRNLAYIPVALVIALSPAQTLGWSSRRLMWLIWSSTPLQQLLTSITSPGYLLSTLVILLIAKQASNGMRRSTMVKSYLWSS